MERETRNDPESSNAISIAARTTLISTVQRRGFYSSRDSNSGLFWFDRVSAETGADGMEPRTVVCAHETFAFSRSFIVPTQANNEDFPFSLEGVRQKTNNNKICSLSA